MSRFQKNWDVKEYKPDEFGWPQICEDNPNYGCGEGEFIPMSVRKLTHKETGLEVMAVSMHGGLIIDEDIWDMSDFFPVQFGYILPFAADAISEYSYLSEMNEDEIYEHDFWGAYLDWKCPKGLPTENVVSLLVEAVRNCYFWTGPDCIVVPAGGKGVCMKEALKKIRPFKDAEIKHIIDEAGETPVELTLFAQTKQEG